MCQHFFYIGSKGLFYVYSTMDLTPHMEVLELGPAIDALKSLSSKFRETGDYEYMMEILLIIDEIESPMLIDFFDMDVPDIKVKA